MIQSYISPKLNHQALLELTGSVNFSGTKLNWGGKRVAHYVILKFINFLYRCLSQKLGGYTTTISLIDKYSKNSSMTCVFANQYPAPLF